MQDFHLEGREYIELNKLLKRMNWVSTGGEANISIDNGEVKVNGNVETRRRNKLRRGDRIEFFSNAVEIR